MAQYSINSFTGASTEAAKPLASQDWAGVINAAVATGETILFDSKDYPIRSLTGTGIAGDTNKKNEGAGAIGRAGDLAIDIRGTGRTKFIHGKELASSAYGPHNLFKFMGPDNSLSPVSSATFRMEGIQYDGQEFTTQKNSASGGAMPSGSGAGFLDIYFYSRVNFEKNLMNGGSLERTSRSLIVPGTGTDPETNPAQYYQSTNNMMGAGWIDTLFGTHGCFNETIRDNSFINAFDCGGYDSGAMIQFRVPYSGSTTTRSQIFRVLQTGGDKRVLIYTPGLPIQASTGDRVYFQRAISFSGITINKGWHDLVLVEPGRYIIEFDSGTATNTAWWDRAKPDGTDGTSDENNELILWFSPQEELFNSQIDVSEPIQYGQNFRTIAVGSPYILVDKTAHGLVSGQRIHPQQVRNFAGVSLETRWYHVQVVNENQFIIVASTNATAANSVVGTPNCLVSEERLPPGKLPGGMKGLVQNNYFEACGNAFSYKRSFQGIWFDKNWVHRSTNGLRCSNVGGPTYGTRTMATGNRFTDIGGLPLILSGPDCIATGNVVNGWGKDLGNPRVALGVSSSTLLGAISMVGVTRGQVSGNLISNEGEWAARTWVANRGPVGIAITNGESETGSTYVNVFDNDVHGADRAFVEAGQNNFNTYTVGTEVNCMAASAKWGGNSVMRRITYSAY